ncbi:MAG: MATE family efflux transporter [Bacteroidales bacterium]|nr:MATE family efflux transporter [Bacteroidales bacterium]
MGRKDILLSRLRRGEPLSGGQQLRLTLALAIPAILAQLSSVLMQYIDSAMVGRLGANPAASIGLVSTSTWILTGFSMAVITGFSVQTAHACGAGDFRRARTALRQGLFSVFVFSLLLSLVGLSISGPLPRWLGGTEIIRDETSAYFRIYAAFLPVGMTGFAASAMLQASGNMKVPSITYISMCALDVVFNYLFIYRLGMGVVGAAWGTGIAESLTTLFVLWYVCTQSRELKIIHEKGSFIPGREHLKTAFGITGPLWLQNVVMRGAYVMSTVIVAPLGPVAIAANSFAITAESFCYMPGYGLEDAATTLVGQSLGAKRKELARSFAWTTIGLGVAIMTVLAVAMYFFAPQLMGILSTDPEVVALGARVLRIEAFAEAMYAASIVGFGVCAGAGSTMVPTLFNFGSMWLVRIGLALVLTPRFGLVGYWIAMCVELNVRGILYLLYVRSGHWMRKGSLLKESPAKI